MEQLNLESFASSSDLPRVDDPKGKARARAAGSHDYSGESGGLTHVDDETNQPTMVDVQVRRLYPLRSLVLVALCTPICAQPCAGRDNLQKACRSRTYQRRAAHVAWHP